MALGIMALNTLQRRSTWLRMLLPPPPHRFQHAQQPLRAGPAAALAAALWLQLAPRHVPIRPHQHGRGRRAPVQLLPAAP